MQTKMGGIIQVNIPDRATLQASYMGYVQGGACLYHQSKKVKMGQKFLF